MTEKLYDQDSSIRIFNAEVLECRENRGNYEVVLNRTAFFPVGGGQSADTGYLCRDEEKVRVLDALEKDGIVYHITDRCIEPGTLVEGKLDYKERFSKMQQHTGEHIVSGIINRILGYKNVGFHLGSEEVTMDYDGELTREQLRQVEWEANEAVAANMPVEVLYPKEDELSQITYRSKIEIEGQVRIVRIPGYDTCACCAPHVKSTGQVGIIKLTGAIRYKGGMRITMLCGFRALCDYNKKEESVICISNRLSTRQDQVADAVMRLEEEIAFYKDKIKRLQEQFLKGKLKEVKPEDKIVYLIEEELDPNAMRRFVNDAMEITGGICAVFAGNDKDGYRYVLGTREGNAPEFSKMLNQACDGKGGGKPPMVQGSLKGKREEIESFIKGV